MGLDMYLYATRRFPADGPHADQVVAAAGAKLDELLRRLASLEQRKHDASLYLWPHMAESVGEDPGALDRVLDAAGMTDLLSDDGFSGAYLGVDGAEVWVQVTAAYWRKANAIHGWFVDNCQGGVDECQESDLIDAEQLMHLRHLCERDAKAVAGGPPAPEGLNLRPRAGFFFGSADADELWVESLVETIAAIDRIIPAAIEAGGVVFTYQASW